MITKIEAKNFLCLRAVSQTLDRFHVVAGPNGSGKSTFFEVPKLLSAFGREGLNGMLERASVQTFEEILYQGRGRHMDLAIEMAVPERLTKSPKPENVRSPRIIRYEVRVGRDEGDAVDEPPRILLESLWLLGESPQVDRSRRVQMELQFPSATFESFEVVHMQAPKRGGWRTIAKKAKSGNSYFKSETTEWNLMIRNAPEDSALSSLPADDRFPVANWFRDELLKGQQHLALHSEGMRKPSPPLKNVGFLPDGSNLPHVVARMKRIGKSAFRHWIEHLRTVLPIEDVEVVTRDEDLSRYLRVRYQGGQWIPSWHLSDGTLRMLALTLLAYMPDSATSTFIEEPENGIHPRAVEAVFQSLRSVYGGQVLVATHSPVFVSLVEPPDLLCFSKTQEGETDIVSGDQHPRLVDWKKDVPLARLYAAGILS